MQLERDWINYPIFIIGHPKSGTSLLNALLDSHPQLMVIPEESDYYNRVRPKVSLLHLKWRQKRIAKNIEIVQIISDQTHFKNFFRGKIQNDISGNLEYEDFDTSLFKDNLISGISEEPRINNRSRLFKIIVKAYFETIRENINESKLKYWVEKTPKHILSYNEIRIDFPNSKFIYVFRDPRDNYLSYKKKWNQSLTPLKFSKNWNESFDKIDDKNKNLLFVKYEDLVLDSKIQLDRIVDFLGIEFNKKLLIPSKNNKSWQGNSMFGNRSHEIDSSNIGRYKMNLSKNELEMIESFCLKRMIEFDYKIETDTIKLKSLKIKFRKEYNRFNPKRQNTKSLRQYLGRFKKLIIG